jgi:hypothetical protein
MIQPIEPDEYQFRNNIDVRTRDLVVPSYSTIRSRKTRFAIGLSYSRNPCIEWPARD